MFKSACRHVAIITLLLLLCGCKQLFETASDLQAKQALFDLIEVQQTYHKKHNRYARNLLEIRDAGLPLQYHTGIVYLEIEYADRNGWRAVALPAESTTARVFAFDSNKGGFYEMDDEEVSSYVLGSLNFIREKQKGQRILAGVALAVIFVFTVLGVRTWIKNRVPHSGWVAVPFLLSIPPLVFSALTLIYMERDIVLSLVLKSLLAANCLLALACLAATWMGFQKIPPGESLTSLSSLAICTILISLFNILVTTHTFLNYSENPDPLEKYINPEVPSPRAGFGAR